MAGCRTAPAQDVIEDALHEALAASAYNRELNRLVGMLRALRERLVEFVDLDPAAELMAAGGPWYRPRGCWRRRGGVHDLR